MSEADGRYDVPRESPPPPEPRYDTVVEPTSGRVADDGPDSLDALPWDDGPATEPEYRDTPVVVRRPDSLAALLLLLAGIAAGVSLLVVWVHGGGDGLVLVANGLNDIGDLPRLLDGTGWEPLAVVFGGAALFLLALLAFVPARTHRFLGVLALLVSVVVAAGVLVPLADADWDVHRWAVGGWLSAAVAGLGLLGALKALLTNARRS
jgi:hypothetical protein